VSATIETPQPTVREEPHPVVVRRFSAWARATHAVLAASVFGLVMTGMPLRYPGAFWARMLLAIWQGPGGAALLHRVFAVGFFLAGAMHVVGLLGAWATGRFRWRSIAGPDSILLRPQDAKNVVANLRYLRGQGPKPQFGRFTYWEKFDYFAEIWGLLVIGLTGLVMWFPTVATRYLPGWMVNAALIFHAYEALLAMGFLFAIHFFNTHLRPDVFPVDPVIFSGNISLEEVRHRYPGWYARLSQKGAGFVPSRTDPSPTAVVISIAYLTIGLVTLMFVMFDAVLEAWNYLHAMF
jgi:cytochrome b subunit of formate dehydrogenase